MKNTKSKREPLLRIAKRKDIGKWKSLSIRLGCVAVALIFGCILFAAFAKTNPFAVLGYVFQGALSLGIDTTMQKTSLLLLVALALIPAFKMKFWNLGGNGQVLMSMLASIAIMRSLGPTYSVALTIPLMIIASIAAGIIWALIPAIFKAFFGTNESLFTLMLNYIAEFTVSYFTFVWLTDSNGVLTKTALGTIAYSHLPTLGKPFVLLILVAALLTAAMYVYLNKSKHGYELTVVGESENTAKYIGINTKKVIIRTLIVSGAVCGLVGLLKAGGLDYTIGKTSHNNMGFTSIMAAWLGGFNPVATAASSFFIAFVDTGISHAAMMSGLKSGAMPEMIIGVVYFFVIAGSFLTEYRIILRSDLKEKLSVFTGKIAGLFKRDKKQAEIAPQKEDNNG